MTVNCWAQLGIEPTSEKADITAAYEREMNTLRLQGNEQQIASLQLAYQQALRWSTPVQPEAIIDRAEPLHSNTQQPEMPVFEDAPTAEQSPTRARGMLPAAIWFVVLATVVILAAKPFDSAQESEPPVAQINWEQDLLSCNNVETAEPTADFETCLALAEEGWQDAQLKIAWAYTREGDYKDWQQTYDWLLAIGEQHQHATLLAHVILFVLGDDEQQRLNGEKRIRSMANVRFAPAEAYLATLFALGLNQIERDANILWLLESAYEKDPSLISVFEMAQIHANGLHTRVNLDKARQFISEYANSDVPYSINNTVWYLATLANNTLYQPEWVVERAKMIVDHDDPTEQYSFIDTLAAAHAANGDFDKAVAAQHHAIAKIEEAGLPDEQAESERKAFLERLEHYLVGDPVVYDDLVIDEETLFDDLKSDIEDVLLDYLNITVEPPEGYVPSQPGDEPNE